MLNTCSTYSSSTSLGYGSLGWRLIIWILTRHHTGATYTTKPLPYLMTKPAYYISTLVSRYAIGTYVNLHYKPLQDLLPPPYSCTRNVTSNYHWPFVSCIRDSISPISTSHSWPLCTYPTTCFPSLRHLITVFGFSRGRFVGSGGNYFFLLRN